MRIAYLDPHPVPDTLPATLQILQTVDALGAAGAQVDLITPRPRNGISAISLLGRELSNNVRLHYLPDLRRRWWFPSSSNKPFYFLARLLLRREHYDAVLVRNIKMADYLLNRSLQTPLFFETHEIFAQSFREQFPNPSPRQQRKLDALVRRERLIYGRARGIIGITQHLLDDIVSHYDIHTPAMVAPDGVDLHLARPSGQPTAGIPTILLYLGSLHPWKGVETLIRAMPLVSSAELHIAGGNDLRIAQLRALAAELGVGDKVTFLGPVAPIKRFELIGRSDICLLPLSNTSIGSRYTSPLKLFEYMAMGKPIVISDLPAIREVVTHEQSALLVEPENPQAIAAAVSRLQQDASLACRLGETTRSLAVDRYSWDSRARGMLQFMEIQLAQPSHH